MVAKHNYTYNALKTVFTYLTTKIEPFFFLTVLPLLNSVSNKQKKEKKTVVLKNKTVSLMKVF